MGGNVTSSPAATGSAVSGASFSSGKAAGVGGLQTSLPFFVAGSSPWCGSGHSISGSKSAAGEGGLLTSSPLFTTSGSLADSGKAVSLPTGSRAINGFRAGSSSPSTSPEVNNKPPLGDGEAELAATPSDGNSGPSGGDNSSGPSGGELGRGAPGYRCGSGSSTSPSYPATGGSTDDAAHQATPGDAEQQATPGEARQASLGEVRQTSLGKARQASMGRVRQASLGGARQASLGGAGVRTSRGAVVGHCGSGCGGFGPHCGRCGQAVFPCAPLSRLCSGC
ncbi:UNVERIFIED_CONTAM: hypothetical protein FKN15_049236 [Acipenser sinensis]